MIADPNVRALLTMTDTITNWDSIGAAVPNYTLDGVAITLAAAIVDALEECGLIIVAKPEES